MIVILRLGHRLGRDARISTHVGLVARVFGADKIIYSGQKDEKMMNSIENIRNNFGGQFDVEYNKNWKSVIENFNGVKVHLTMYGISKERVRKSKNMLIIVGGEKVPGEVYEMVDYNISITNQPHSEVASLGVFLDNLSLKTDFNNAKRVIEPSERSRIINS